MSTLRETLEAMTKGKWVALPALPISRFYTVTPQDSVGYFRESDARGIARLCSEPVRVALVEAQQALFSSVDTEENKRARIVRCEDALFIALTAEVKP